ncbi:MAG: serine/threonine protein kinase [Akkermansiaceae bacterium]
MSMVYSARDITLEREVAIKVLNEEYSKDAQRMKQFEQEALITAAISHPHVVRVFTVGSQYGRYYIAMEKVSGENLEQKIARSDALSEEDVLPMAAEIIAGLRAAKHAGLIHRDVKPGNILFDAMGNVKIVDFGLALVTQGGKAKAEEIWATPYYVPPEALDGREEDFRSDIYALGATLYHALSGRPPLRDKVKTTKAVRKAKEDVLPLAQVAPWLKPETCYMVDKAMALAPGNRFSSYVEMEEAWQAAYQATQRQGASEPIHSRDRAERRAKKSGMAGIIIASAVALLLVGSAIAIFISKNKDDPSTVNGDSASDSTFSPSDDAYDPAVAERIARMVKKSHNRLGEQEYDQARDIFFQMMSDPKVREPAASWAGIEAVIATWLEGNTGDATRTIYKVLQHMSERNISETEKVAQLGKQLASPAIITDVDAGQNSIGVVQLMAVALKNWEMGAWDAAVIDFEKVIKHPLPQRSPLRVYRQIAERYLADYRLLQPYEDMQMPGDVSGSQHALADLQKRLQSLKTRGRARFYVRTWQLRLHRHMKALRNDAVAKGDASSKAPRYSDVIPKFHQLLEQAKYAEASDLLQDVRMEKYEEEVCDSWIYLADSASAFLGTLEQVIPDSGVNMILEDRGGKKYQRIVSAKPGGLNLKATDGEVFVPWGKIKPESVLSIHQKAFKQTLSTLEGQLRTEQAICYAWLTGMKEKAKIAAQKLSPENRAFRKRWESTMRAQHVSP